jgi:hypothetical protein
LRSLTTFSVAPTGVLTGLVTQPTNTLGAFGALNGIAYLPPSGTLTTISAPTITYGQDATVIVTVASAPGTPNV